MEAFAPIRNASIEIASEQLAAAGSLEFYFCPTLTVVGFHFINQPAVAFIQGVSADQAVASTAGWSRKSSENGNIDVAS